jgi:cytochrome b561
MDERLGTAAAYHRYTKVAIALHWIIAALILYNLTSGLLRGFLPRGFFQFHVSAGLTILILSVARVVWRLTHKPPPFLPMKTWEAKLAHGVHFLLYAAMLLLPFSGWALISSNPPAGSPGAAYVEAQRAQQPGAPGGQGGAPRRRGPTMFWGIVPVPLIGALNEIGRTPDGVPEQREVHERLETFHGFGGWVMLVLLLLHVGGAVKHHLVDHEPELGRMGVGRAPEQHA